MSRRGQYLLVTIGATRFAVPVEALIAVERVRDVPERAPKAVDLAWLFWPGHRWESPDYCLQLQHQGARCGALVMQTHGLISAAAHLEVPPIYRACQIPVIAILELDSALLQVIDVDWIFKCIRGYGRG